jgi:hypothetical protein
MLLDYDRGISRNVLGQMTRDNPPFDIRRPARGEVDKKNNVLALVERRLRSECRSKKQDRAEQEK